MLPLILNCVFYLPDICRGRPLLSPHNVKLGLLTVRQGFETFALNHRVMNEDVSTLGHESEAFLIVKPFHGSLPVVSSCKLLPHVV